MAFSVSYYDLLNKNIRHVYSSLPSNVRFRCDPTPGVTLNPHDGCLTPPKKRPPQPRCMPERLYRRLWAYSPEFGSPMPRAPAFRCVSTDEAKVIVNRVSQMTKTHRRRRQSHYAIGESDSVAVCSRASSPHSASSGTRRCRSSVEMEALTERVMRPTTAFSIRCDLREGSVLDPVEVVAQRSSGERAKSAV